MRSTPQSQAAAELAAEQNAKAREKRAQHDAAHAAELQRAKSYLADAQRFAAAGGFRNGNRPSPAPAANRPSCGAIDATAVYRERNTPNARRSTPPAPKSSPRTFADLSAAAYGRTAETYNDPMLPTSARGGAR